MSKPYVLVVTGSRPRKDESGKWLDFSSDEVGVIFTKLNYLNKHYGIARMYEGHAAGVDRIAYGWAKKHMLEDQIFSFPVTKQDWDTIGPSAGPKRNERMLNAAIQYATTMDLPIVVLAVTHGDLTESKGTYSMVRFANKANVTVHHVILRDEVTNLSQGTKDPDPFLRITKADEEAYEEFLAASYTDPYEWEDQPIDFDHC